MRVGRGWHVAPHELCPCESMTASPLQVRDIQFEWGVRTYVMAILNVTPDSFSGDGIGTDPERLRARVGEILSDQPDIIDVGGESTRPGATPIAPDEELARVLPAIQTIRGQSAIPISIDTRRPQVARAALHAGADVVNDVSGMEMDPSMFSLVAERRVPLVITHSRRAQASRAEFGAHFRPVAYGDLLTDMHRDMQELLERARSAGIPNERVIVDPGFGFGKAPDQNIELLRRLAEVQALGLPMLVGVSRKSFIGQMTGAAVSDRLEGSLAAAVIAISHGADMVRVHDVRATQRAVAVADAIFRHSGHKSLALHRLDAPVTRPG